MSESIILKPAVELGVVLTHAKFVGSVVPDDDGRLPRDEDGKIVLVAEMERLTKGSPVKIQGTQLSIFPGIAEEDTEELMTGLKGLGLTVHLILMVGGADPMNPADEDKVVEMLVSGLEVAKKYDISSVSSTSIEEWMQPGATPKTGADLDAAIAQNVAVHTRAYRDGGVEGSCIDGWHIEFLRGGEFQTFTDIGIAAKLIGKMNEALGKKFFKVIVDAAHCGDSTFSIPENEKVIAELAASDELGLFHASAKTTRGCLSTDDGWIGALLGAAARTGKLKTVFVELFNHEDAALQGLRDLEPGHGFDTTDGRTYTQTVIDGLVDVARRLNNLQARGILK